MLNLGNHCIVHNQRAGLEMFQRRALVAPVEIDRWPHPWEEQRPYGNKLRMAFGVGAAADTNKVAVLTRDVLIVTSKNVEF